MPVLLSLLSAMAYGLGDFVGGVASKKANPWSVALVSQLSGAVLILLVTLVTGGSPTGQDLLWAVVAGVGNGFGTAFLYRGLSSGRMGVVAPVSGVGTVVVPVAVGVLAGERPEALVWIGIVLALPGIWLVAREPVATVDPDVSPGNGLADGILAGLGFGALFAALAQIPDEAGFLPLAVNQLVACAAVIAVATALRLRWVPREPAAAAGLVPGVRAALATGAFLVATQGGHLTVTAVIASLYPAFTVLLATTVLREHVHRAQVVGLGLCAVAVALVATG